MDLAPVAHCDLHLGPLLTVVVHRGCWQDHAKDCIVLMRLGVKFRRIRVIFDNSAYVHNNPPARVG